MKINCLQNFQYSHDIKNSQKHSINFRGHLEDNFFAALDKGDLIKQINTLQDIDFDISATEKKSGNNFLHSAFINNHPFLIEAALEVLQNSSEEDRKKILNKKNNDNKTPLDYTNNEILIGKINHILFPENKVKSGESLKNQILGGINTRDKSGRGEIVLNELSKGSTIEDTENTIDFFDSDDEVEMGQTDKKYPSFGDVIGLESAKAELQKSVIDRLNKRKERLALGEKEVPLDTPDGILLHGASRNGKTFLINALENEINEKTIRVNDVKELIDAFEKAESDFKSTSKHTIIFFDNIQSHIQKTTDFRISPETTRIMNLIDNSSQKGVVLLAATSQMDKIEPEAIASGRFDKHIEISPPDLDIRQKIFEANLKNNEKISFSDNDYQTLAKITSGFSAAAIKSIINETVQNNIEKEDINLSKFKESIEKYSKERKIGNVSEESPHAIYDPENLKREKIKYPKNFDEVAGMKSVKKRLKEEIVDKFNSYTLAYYKENNIKVSGGGFILHGPPGTGKTFIITSLAGETGIPLYKLDISKFESSYKGETIKNLNKIFNELQTKFEKTGEYSIVFIDEVDSLLGKRENASESKKEVINALLPILDNPVSKGLIVICATNFIDSIDGAVGRSGRIGKRIFVPVPDNEAREAIFKLQFKNKKIVKEIAQNDIDEFVKRTSGFGAADIVEVINNTFDKAMRERQTTLTRKDFLESIKQYSIEKRIPEINERNKTSMYDTEFLRRVEIKSSDPQTLDDLGGMNEVKTTLYNTVMEAIDPVIKKEMEENGEKFSNGILLYGPPRCGKTHIVKAISAHSNIPLYQIKMSEFGSKYVAETAQNLKKVFDQLKYKYAETKEPSILFFDECDSFFAKVAENEQYRTAEINTLKEEMQSAGQNGIIVLAATNEIQNLNEAIIGDGRFDAKIYVGYPDVDARKEILSKILSKGKRTEHLGKDEIIIDKLAKETEGFSIGTIDTVINECAKKARRNMQEQVSLDGLVIEIDNKRKEQNKLSEFSQQTEVIL